MTQHLSIYFFAHFHSQIDVWFEFFSIHSTTYIYIVCDNHDYIFPITFYIGTEFEKISTFIEHFDYENYLYNNNRVTNIIRAKHSFYIV